MIAVSAGSLGDPRHKIEFSLASSSISGIANTITLDRSVEAFVHGDTKEQSIAGLDDVCPTQHV